MAHEHDKHPPKVFLMVICGLVAFTLISVAAVQLTGSGHVSDWQSRSTEVLELRFEDAADGSVLALDAATGETIREWPPATGGFVRTAMRALALDRKQAGVGEMPAFRLHRISGGRFIMEDPATGKWVGLDAFGRDNVGEFAQLFDDKAAQQ